MAHESGSNDYYVWVWVWAWERIATTLVALALLIWQGIFAAAPSALIVGASVTLLGVAPALRADDDRKRRREGRPVNEPR